MAKYTIPKINSIVVGEMIRIHIISTGYLLQHTHTDKEGDTHTHKDRNTEKEQVGVGEGREEARSCVLSF